MRPARRGSSLISIGLPVATALLLAACTPGGQFDPTTLFANDMFDTKKKLPGPREPVFPNGVPGIETGVPPELVKGYKPPEQSTDAAPNGEEAAPAAESGATAASPAEAAAKPEAKPKPKAKPRLARAPAQSSAPSHKPPTRISVGSGPKPASPAASVQQSSDSSVWPAPPPTGPNPQAGQPNQSIWPSPPAAGSSPQ